MNKTLPVLIGVVVVIAVVAGIYLLTNNSSQDEWQVSMSYLPSGASAGCSVDPNITQSQIDETRTQLEELRSTANYILSVKVLSLKETPIDDMNGKRVLSFQILNWEKGELGYIPKKLTLSTDYNPSLAGVEGDTPFGRFKEGESYKVYLEEKNGEISFLGDDRNDYACGSPGIIKL